MVVEMRCLQQIDVFDGKLVGKKSLNEVPIGLLVYLVLKNGSFLEKAQVQFMYLIKL